MPTPTIVDVPHKLGRAEAKRRLEVGVGKIFRHLPGGGEAHVSSSWPSAFQMLLDLKAMNQSA